MKAEARSSRGRPIALDNVTSVTDWFRSRPDYCEHRLGCYDQQIADLEFRMRAVGGKTSKIDARMHRCITVRLDRLNTVGTTDDLNVSGYNFHPLKGSDPTRFSIHVNGPWCVTFEFSNGDAYNVDFEQYH